MSGSACVALAYHLAFWHGVCLAGLSNPHQEAGGDCTEEAVEQLGLCRDELLGWGMGARLDVVSVASGLASRGNRRPAPPHVWDS